MRITTEPRSDQWNADDFIGGPRTFTIAGVKVGSAEQKYDIELVEGEGRSWRPPLTVLRLLVAGWGDDATVWTGRRVTLFKDPSIRFGKDEVGGIRVSHMSHLPDGKALKVALSVSRGKRAPHVVQPMTDEPAPPAVDRMEPKMTARTRGQLFALMSEQGWDDDQQRAWLSQGLNRSVESRSTLTEVEAFRAIEALRALKESAL
jgi:hypothetical protein